MKKGEQLFKKIMNALTDEFNRQVKAKEFTESKDLFLHMREIQKRVIEESGIKRNKSKWLSASWFMYVLAQSLYASDAWIQKKDVDAPIKVWNFIYSGMTLTAIHTCPDVEARHVKELIRQDQRKLLGA